jgi:tetratricopeptide (TPR) repeat protein
MLTMLALGALWCAMHEPERKCWWLAVASAVYGLALGARPSLLFGAVILLVPVAQARREGRPVGAPLVAAIIPMMLIGLGLMLYNAMRFGNPFEFGLHYQLHAERRITGQFFGLQYLWFNFRVYFLEPVRWTVRSPFVRGIVMPPAPPHLGYVELPYGVLTNIPFVWLALAAPLAWRNRSEREGWVLRWFVIAVGWLFGIAALTLGCYYCTGGRFEVEFLPALLLLAVVGILGLERALAPSSESGLADRSVPRCAARCGWGLLLGFSVAFNLLAGVGYHAEVEAGLGSQLLREGKVSEAFGRYQQALRINPDCAEAHAGLGTALAQLGRIPEAIAQYEQALQIKPDYAEVHLNFGSTLATQGKAHEAIAHYEDALRIKPDYPDAHESLGNVLMQLGRLPEAIGHYEQALRINPDLAEAHNNLATALGHSGQIEEAIQHYQRALQINPDFAEAHDNLGIVLAHTGKIEEAIAHFDQALRIKPDYAQAHYNLGKALAQAGREPEAIEQYENALRIQPDFTPAQNALAQLQDRR